MRHLLESRSLPLKSTSLVDAAQLATPASTKNRECCVA